MTRTKTRDGVAKARKYQLVGMEMPEAEYTFIGGKVFEGPIEDILVVTFPNDVLHRILSLPESRGVDHVKQALKDAGWEGAIFICPDDMKFARFEPVPEERPEVSLPEVEAAQVKALQELRDEDDQAILARVRQALEDEKVCPHCGDPGCAGAEYDPGDCPEGS